jgi:hypothetical protein
LTLLPEGAVPLTATDSTTPEQPPTTSKTMKMRTLEEFKSFCQQNLLTDLKTLEAIRKQVLQSIIVVGIIVLIILGCLINFFPTQYIILCLVYKVSPPYLIIFLFLLGFLGCLWGWVAFYTSATETYASGFKSKIIQKIFDFINNGQNLKYSSYSSDTEYTMSAFNHSQIFHSLLKPNKITENDIEYPEEIFEPKLFKSMLSLAPMREYFENIQLMLGIVEDLNLNKRIWRVN